MLRIFLDHGFILTLMRVISLASLVSSMGEVRPAARVVTIVVFIAKSYKFLSAQGTKCVSILTGIYLNLQFY